MKFIRGLDRDTHTATKGDNDEIRFKSSEADGISLRIATNKLVLVQWQSISLDIYR